MKERTTACVEEEEMSREGNRHKKGGKVPEELNSWLPLRLPQPFQPSVAESAPKENPNTAII